MTDTKIYSKKSCQKIILKCTMKLLLDTTFNSGNSNIDFKTYIKKGTTIMPPPPPKNPLAKPVIAPPKIKSKTLSFLLFAI